MRRITYRRVNSSVYRNPNGILSYLGLRRPCVELFQLARSGAPSHPEKPGDIPLKDGGACILHVALCSPTGVRVASIRQLSPGLVPMHVTPGFSKKQR